MNIIMNYKKTLLLATSIVAIGTLSPSDAESANPYYYTDREVITMTGDITEIKGDNFMMDYGTGSVLVEMDDWDLGTDDAKFLREGEKVTVTGRIDNDLFEMKKVEAGTVFAHDRYTYIYADSADEEGPHTFYAYSGEMPDGMWIEASGMVQNIEGSEFQLDTGSNLIQIDTDTMAYNPLDDRGYQLIDEGDRVTVSGLLNDDFFEGNEIEAVTLVELQAVHNMEQTYNN